MGLVVQQSSYSQCNLSSLFHFCFYILPIPFLPGLTLLGDPLFPEGGHGGPLQLSLFHLSCFNNRFYITL